MKATIYFTNKCGTARKTLAILEEAGAEITIINYLENPPSKDELKRLYKRAGMTVRDGLRAKEAIAAELGLLDETVPDEQILEAMMQHPILINRPLVETEKGAKLCRPQELVHDLL